MESEKFANRLTKEEVSKLKSEDITIRELKILRAKCNHRSLDGSHDMISQEIATGISTCGICGAKFSSVECDNSKMQETCTDMYNLLETIKLVPMDNDDYDIICDTLLNLDKIRDICRKSVKEINKKSGIPVGHVPVVEFSFQNDPYYKMVHGDTGKESNVDNESLGAIAYDDLFSILHNIDPALTQ